MEKYIPISWLNENACILKRFKGTYTEEFSIYHQDVPIVEAIPADKIKILIKRAYSNDELIKYLELLLKEETNEDSK